MSKTKFIEETLFGGWMPMGTAEENYSGIKAEYGEEAFTMEDGDILTLEELQEYFRGMQNEK